jgi:adenosylcobyric acid synthase
VRVRWIRDPGALGLPDAVIVPGTKHTLADLAWLRESGLAGAIAALAGRGRAVVGICGGYQMLCRAIHDPQGVEGHGGDAQGLGLLDAEVLFASEKATWQVQARLYPGLAWLDTAGELSGYEIHAGQAQAARPLLSMRRANGETVPDGASSADGRIWGTHLHGLFANSALRRAWLHSIGWQPGPEPLPEHVTGPAAFDHLADALAAALDLSRLDALLA